MTILKAIAAVDRMEPNDYSTETKLRWLSAFDGQVRKDVIDTHTGAPELPFSGYDSETDIESTELLIPAPYDEVYPLMLSLHISMNNADTARTELVTDELSSVLRGFTDWYNRTHLPCAGPALHF